MIIDIRPRRPHLTDWPLVMRWEIESWRLEGGALVLHNAEPLATDQASYLAEPNPRTVIIPLDLIMPAEVVEQ